MREFDRLSEVIDHLMGPQGCPWDREQTLESMRTPIIEEVFEMVEAVDKGDTEELREELGDLFFNVLFFCKLAQKEGFFSETDVLSEASEKLVRRHPHVFGEEKAPLDSETALEIWDRQKKKEKQHRQSALDGIPSALPLLLRAQKVVKRLKKREHFEEGELSFQEGALDTEESLGKAFLSLVAAAQENGIDAETALRKELHAHETRFRLQEASCSME